jgi:four helix bundle protein
MGKIQRFEEMKVWQAAQSLIRSILSISSSRLFSRDFGLREQIRRASVRIASNIAEGFEGQGNPSFCRFLASASVSAAEVRAQLYLALDLSDISNEDFTRVVSTCESVSRQLTGFIGYLKGATQKE